MKRFSILICLMVIGFLLMVANILLAQQESRGRERGGPPQMQGPQMNPEQMMERRMQQIIERLKLSSEEASVLKPKIEALMNLRMEQGREMRELISNLQKAVDAKDTNNMKASLNAIKAKREEQRKKLEKAESEITELLTIEQEANLTILGVINSDGIGGRFLMPVVQQQRQRQPSSNR